MTTLWTDRIERVVNVEIDPVVARLEARFAGGLRDDRVVTLVDDGRRALTRMTDRFDFIIVDAYARQIDIPFHMATEEFFALVYDRLREGGVVALNASAVDLADSVLQGVARSMASAFETVVATPVQGFPNVMAWSRRGVGPLDFDDVDPNAATFPAALAPALNRARRVTARLEIADDATRLHDADAPVEWLLR